MNEEFLRKKYREILISVLAITCICLLWLSNHPKDTPKEARLLRESFMKDSTIRANDSIINALQNQIKIEAAKVVVASIEDEEPEAYYSAIRFGLPVGEIVDINPKEINEDADYKYIGKCYIHVEDTSGAVTVNEVSIETWDVLQIGMILK